MRPSPTRNSSWDAYWDSPTTHRLIMPQWTSYTVQRIHGLRAFQADDVVLDFGAGNGVMVGSYGSIPRRVYALEKSSYQRQYLKKRFAGNPRVVVIASLDEISEPVTFVLINSVMQYVDLAQAQRILQEIAPHCATGARLLISDLIPKRYSRLADLRLLLRECLREAFLWQFIGHVAYALVVNLRINTAAHSLRRYTFHELAVPLEELGFRVELVKENVTPSKTRFAIMASKKPA